MASNQPDIDLRVDIGRLSLPNPILVASGTFGYAREMQEIVDVARLGGMIPKTITPSPRRGNSPWRTLETPAGMLNSIGLDNDGVEAFVEHHLPYLIEIDCPTIVSVAGHDRNEFVSLASRLASFDGIAALELNVSCPNVSGGVDFGSVPDLCFDVVSSVRGACDFPILAKLTPNVTDIVGIAQAAADAGADGLSMINTVLAMAVDWRNRRPLLGNVLGGLSGPAIKPIALRCVHQVAGAVDIPVIGVGGIATIDDVMEFLVTGASAVQIGTANFYDPRVSMRILDQLPEAIGSLDASSVREIVGSMVSQAAPACRPSPENSQEAVG